MVINNNCNYFSLFFFLIFRFFFAFAMCGPRRPSQQHCLVRPWEEHGSNAAGLPQQSRACVVPQHPALCWHRAPRSSSEAEARRQIPPSLDWGRVHDAWPGEWAERAGRLAKEKGKSKTEREPSKCKKHFQYRVFEGRQAFLCNMRTVCALTLSF